MRERESERQKKKRVDKMSDGKDVEGGASSGPLEDPELNYVAPKEKSLDELLSSDAGDEALEKYKKTLLGEAVKGTGSVVVEENDPRGVILKKLALVVPGRKDEEIDLTGDLKKIKKTVRHFWIPGTIIISILCFFMYTHTHTHVYIFFITDFLHEGGRSIPYPNRFHCPKRNSDRLEIRPENESDGNDR